MVTCPKCKGTKRIPLPERSRRHADILAGYDKATDTLECDNCGGQTMEGRATGEVFLDGSGKPCLHEYNGKRAGNCYHVYTCRYCGHRYDIDSGD